MFYIGSTANFSSRKARHIYNLRRNIHKNKYLQSAWNEYGEDAFVFVVLEEVDNNSRLFKEQRYLNKLKPFGDNGYNIAINARNSFLIEKTCVICGDKFKTNSKYKNYCKKCLDGDYISDDEINVML
jgi:group I intron endonuclease